MKTQTLLPLGYRGLLIAGAVVALFASFVMLVQADVAPTVTATPHSSNTDAIISSANIGSGVYTTVSVASSSATTSPTGTVVFNRYDNTSCTGSPVVQSGVSLVNGMATSSTAIMTNTGLSFRVHYDGQSGVYSANDSVCMPVTAMASSTGLASSLSSNNVSAGSSVTQSVTLQNATSNAGGSVAYVVYSDLSCNTAWVGAGVRTVTNGSVPASDAIMFNNAGNYYWKAVYSGDANNAQATSSCLSLTVLATSTTPTTTAAISGTIYNDTDKDSIKDGGEAGVANFTVNLRQGSGFGAAVYKTITSDSNGMYSFGNLANGTYSIELINKAGWHQNTDDYNAVVISGQVSLTNKDFSVWATSSSTATTTGNSAISGVVYNDLDKDYVKDAGEAGIAGFTVNLYNAYNANSGKKNVTPFKTTTTDANGMYSFTGLANGKYSVELINKSGWHQNTGDYHKLNIKNGVALTNIDFANSSTSQGNGNGNGNGGKGNNGNHYGWQNFWDRFGSWPWGQNKNK